MRIGILGYAICSALTVLLLSPWWPDVQAWLLSSGEWWPSGSVYSYPMPMTALFALAPCCVFPFRLLRSARSEGLRSGAGWLAARAGLVGIGVFVYAATTLAIRDGRETVDARWNEAVAGIGVGMTRADVLVRLEATRAPSESQSDDDGAERYERRYNFGFGSDRGSRIELALRFDDHERLHSARYTREDFDHDLDTHACRVLIEHPADPAVPAPYDCPDPEARLVGRPGAAPTPAS